MTDETERPLAVVNSVAPIRICDNGCWTDTWFAGHGQVFNVAVYPYAEVQVAIYPARDARGPPRHPPRELRGAVRGAARRAALGAPPPPGGRDRVHEGPARPAARGDDPLRGAGGRGHGHLGRGHGGPRRGPRRPDPRAPHAARGRRRRPARRDRDARPAVRHPGPARLRLRRDQLHRDVRLPARLGLARPGAEPGLVGARAAPPSRLPRQVARLLGPPRGGHPVAGERRAGLPRHRRAAPRRAALAGRPLRGRLRGPRAGP